MNVYLNGGAQRRTVPEPGQPRSASPLPPQTDAGDRTVGGMKGTADRRSAPGATGPHPTFPPQTGQGKMPRPRTNGRQPPTGESSPREGEAERTQKTPSGPLRNPKRSLDGVLARLDPGRWETEDLLILAILWLLYRESGDRELLLALGAYIFL